jgi:hypothetical protein
MNRLISSETCDYYLCKSFRALAIFLLFLPGIRTFAQDPTPDASKPNFDIYGHAMVDMGYDFKQTDPNWFDVIRPSRLPSFKDEFGKDGNFYSGVRQSRLGVRGYIPTSLGQMKTIFEFELFGTGVDAGQTTFRLRHAWGELGHFGAGQTWSPFMDPDVFPNSLEYWGPNGMVFFRNVQVRYTLWSKGDSRLVIAAERPGASGDQGVYAGRIELQGCDRDFQCQTSRATCGLLAAAVTSRLQVCTARSSGTT